MRLILVALALICSIPRSAAAYGAVDTLFSGWGEYSLFVPALRSGEIRYCLRLEETKRFAPESISLQIEMALKLWLKAVVHHGRDMAQTTRITQIRCDEKNLNLEVVIGPQLESRLAKMGGFQLPRRSGSGFYSQVVINSGYDWYGFRYVDTFDLLPGLNKNLSAFERFFADQKLEGESLARQAGIEKYQLFWSTYVVLIHELGHSFGLCDTYEGQVGRCDPYFRSPRHDDSVMRTSNKFYLTDEDARGINEIARVYRQGLIDSRREAAIFTNRFGPAAPAVLLKKNQP